jgi:hypothetical protein
MVRVPLCVSVRTYQIATGFWVLLRESLFMSFARFRRCPFPKLFGKKERKKERKKGKKALLKNRKKKKKHNLLTWRNSLLLGRSITHAALINE